MARQSFRDVNTVVLAGYSLVGVTKVGLSNEGAVINFNSDAGAYRQDVGLTKQVAGVDLERMSSQKMRDILSAVFTSGTGTVTFGRVQRARLAQRGTVLRDSGDADAWIAYVGVTDIGGEAEVSFRDLAQAKSAVLAKGRKGTLTITVPKPRTGFGLPAQTASETHKVTCMVAQHEVGAQHGELNDGRTRFEMYGATNPWTVSGYTGSSSLRPVAVGTRGSVKWTAPAADAGAGEATTVTNGIVTEVEVTVEHGAYARSTVKVEAASTDGQTSPVS